VVGEHTLAGPGGSFGSLVEALRRLLTRLGARGQAEQEAMLVWPAFRVGF
jgi:hypothetical protein